MISDPRVRETRARSAGARGRCHVGVVRGAQCARERGQVGRPRTARARDSLQLIRSSRFAKLIPPPPTDVPSSPGFATRHAADGAEGIAVLVRVTARGAKVFILRLML